MSSSLQNEPCRTALMIHDTDPSCRGPTLEQRQELALWFGVSWLLLGWGTYAFVVIRRWLRRRRALM
jgi:hypothetical protein